MIINKNALVVGTKTYNLDNVDDWNTAVEYMYSIIDRLSAIEPQVKELREFEECVLTYAKSVDISLDKDVMRVNEQQYNLTDYEDWESAIELLWEVQSMVEFRKEFVVY